MLTPALRRLSKPLIITGVSLSADADQGRNLGPTRWPRHFALPWLGERGVRARFCVGIKHGLVQRERESEEEGEDLLPRVPRLFLAGRW